VSGPIDLAIRGKRVLVDGELVAATVLVRDGRIVAIEAGVAPSAAARAERVIEAGDDLVSPGFVDLHVHFDNPAVDLADDFRVGTANAALGGCTFVVEHPFSTPPTTTAERYAAKLELAATSAHVDFGLWGALTGPGLGELAGQRALGAAGFKAFLPENDMDYPSASDEELRIGLAETARDGGLVLVHAEDREGLRDGIDRERSAGRTDYAAVLAARAPELELCAVRRVLELAELTGGAVHFVHLSLPEAVDLVTSARARGVRASCEATAHHLLLDRDDFLRLGWRALCAPPLRARRDVEGLWRQLRDGEIDAVVSDHCAYSIADKLPADADALDGPFGIQGAREFAPVFVDEALRRGWSLPEALALVTSRPADLCGASPHKGRIRVGADADFALLRLGSGASVDAGRQVGPDRWSPYDGRECAVQVQSTIVRGETVVANGRLVGEAGAGRFVPLAVAPGHEAEASAGGIR
jgi:allantoinase